MTKKQYLALRKKSKKDPLSISFSAACSIDSFYKLATIGYLEKKLATEKIPIFHREFIMKMVEFHYGSVEADDYLQSINAYPTDNQLPEEI